MNTSSKVKPLEIGSIYGKWTVLSFSHIQDNKARPAYWNCICECGTERALNSSMLRSGRSVQCHSCNGKVRGRKGLNKQSKKHLYIVRCGDYFKIGSSDNPKRRVKDLQSSNPYPLELVAILENEGHNEAKWHDKYRKQHHQGEWFYGSCEVL